MEELTKEEQNIFDLGIAIGQLPKPQDAYTWKVTYTDSISTSEYDSARPDGRGWAEREEKPVQAITLLSVEHATEAASIPVPEGAAPIFFRRRILTINPNTRERTQEPTVHCIGWKHDTEALYLFVYDDGSTLLTNDLQAV